MSLRYYALLSPLLRFSLQLYLLIAGAFGPFYEKNRVMSFSRAPQMFELWGNTAVSMPLIASNLQLLDGQADLDSMRYCRKTLDDLMDHLLIHMYDLVCA